MSISLRDIIGRFTIPSGIVTTTTDSIEKVAMEIPEIGVITTKSIGLHRKEGNREPILAQYDSKGTFQNAFGLANPGAEEFAKELKEIYPLPNGKFLLTSIFGSTAEELQDVAKIVSPYSDGLELNFSCPHAEKGYGATIGSSPELTKKFTKAVKDTVNIPVSVKLTPNVEDIGLIAKAAVEGGADAISAINTIGPYESQILSYEKGGISGSGVKEKGLQCIGRISEVLKVERLDKKIPIIAMGGISSAQDVLDYENAGASFFGVGTVLAGMNAKTMKDYFANLEGNYKLLKQGSKETNRKILNFINPNLMKYESYKVIRIEQVTDDLRIFYLDHGIKAKPGQFVFARIHSPNGHEKPLSIADDSPLTLAVRKIGPFTSKLFELKEGDTLDIRGPYGNTFDAPHTDVVLVGGGTGLAPLHFMAKYMKRVGKNAKISVFMGARNKSQLLFKKEFEKYCEVIVATEDGSEGTKGFVTDALKNYLQSMLSKDKISFCNCGPELMIEKVVKIENDSGNAGSILSSIERYMKCGVGLCGTCSIDGRRSCVDGPIFTFDDLSKSKHFGKFKRDVSGSLVSFK